MIIMCPLYPLHIIISYAIVLIFIWVLSGSVLAEALDSSLPLNVRLTLNETAIKVLGVKEDQTQVLTLFVDDLPPDLAAELLIEEQSDDGFSHVEFSPKKLNLRYDSVTGAYSEETLNVSGTFVGFSKIKFILSSGKDDQELKESAPMPIKVHRETKTLDIIFIHVVILLVLVAFINMGCAINLEVIKDNFRRPLALSVGLASQYLFMPLLAYGLGYALFSSSRELWLGLFFSGCAPGGGGSNMWTYLLGGSLDLSITMTFLSTVIAFVALPLWTYALAPTIYAEGYFGELPYRNIATLVFALVVPCCIGLAIRRCCPKAADFLKRMLKPLSIIFIVFILTFGVYTKFYLFYFFTWKVALAGFCLPFCGFVFGFIVSLLLRRKPEDVIAVSVETGVQNTGLAIGVIKVALGEFEPLGDIAMVLPVAVATMTPLPLFAALIWRRFRGKRNVEAEFGEKYDITEQSLHSVTYAAVDGNKNSLPNDHR